MKYSLTITVRQCSLTDRRVDRGDYTPPGKESRGSQVPCDLVGRHRRWQNGCPGRGCCRADQFGGLSSADARVLWLGGTAAARLSRSDRRSCVALVGFCVSVAVKAASMQHSVRGHRKIRVGRAMACNSCGRVTSNGVSDRWLSSAARTPTDRYVCGARSGSFTLSARTTHELSRCSRAL